MKKQPTYLVHEIVEMVGFFGRSEMKVLVWLIEEECDRYEEKQLFYLRMVVSHRYGEIEIEEMK